MKHLTITSIVPVLIWVKSAVNKTHGSQLYWTLFL